MSAGNANGARVLAVIPARYASARFPGKVLARIAGYPLVYHVYQRARKARLVSQTLIATDSEEVRDALQALDAEVVMTRDNHPTGTDRIAEVAANNTAEIIVNVQGDEVFIEPETIDAVIRPLLEMPEAMMATARHLITDARQIHDPNVVKVVCDQRGFAIYFSRQPIPHIRDAADRGAAAYCYWQHVGLYAYRRDFLLRYARMPQTPLERLEKLEQLRALEHGHRIAVVDTTYPGIGVDTPEDLERARRLMEGSG